MINILSYSTIQYCLQPENSHNWLNKQMGAKVPDNEFFRNGKRLHGIIQPHLSGKKIDERLSHINYKFPIVEEVDFDPRCQFIFPILRPGVTLSEENITKLSKMDAKKIRFSTGYVAFWLESISKYWMTGFFDGLNPQELRFAEIKTSTKMWTVGDFQRSVQRKIYSLAKPEYKEAIGITAFADDTQWPTMRPKVYPIPCTQKDREQALEWILRGVETIEKGEFKGGLDANGKCAMKFCNYGENCQFK